MGEPERIFKLPKEHTSKKIFSGFKVVNFQVMKFIFIVLNEFPVR